MKKYKAIAVCAIILAVVLVCGGCTAVQQNFDDTMNRRYTESMLDALIADDFQAAYAVVQEVCTKEDFEPVFTQMREFLGDTDSYELKLLSYSSTTNFSGGQQSNVTSTDYEMTTQSASIIVSVSTADQVGVYSFYLTPYENTDYYFTGTLQSMENATAAQWIFLLLNVIAIGFAGFAIVDCCSRKIRKKALWILLLVFGFVSIAITTQSNVFRMNFNIGWITAYSAFIRYGSGTVMIRLMLPIGAIVYFIMRRSLLKESVPEAVPVETEPSATEENSTAEQQAAQIPAADQPESDG